MLFGNFESLAGCRNPRIRRLGAYKSLYSIFSRDLEAFVLYYVMGVSVPSLHRESTDSLIITYNSQKTFKLKMKAHIGFRMKRSYERLQERFLPAEK